jgi:hypothetical protein
MAQFALVLTFVPLSAGCRPLLGQTTLSRRDVWTEAGRLGATPVHADMFDS